MRATSRRRSSAAFAAGLLLPYHGFPRASRATFLLVGADTLASFECLDKIPSSLRRGSRLAVKRKLHGSLIVALENVLAFEVHDFAVLTSLSSVAGDFSAPESVSSPFVVLVVEESVFALVSSTGTCWSATLVTSSLP
jgi:hypothetical protein